MIEELIKRMTPHRDKLIANLKKKGIEFLPKDGDLENVIFFNDKKAMKITWKQFYRYSGIHSFKQDYDERFFRLVPMSDDMFMNSFMKSIIEYFFKDKTK
jgi:hypothetical protein